MKSNDQNDILIGKSPQGRNAARGGMVLVIAIWLVTTLTIFGIGLSRAAWTSYYFSKRLIDEYASLQLANAVVLLVKLERKGDETVEYDALSEYILEGEYAAGELKAVYKVVDEESKININIAPGSVLKNLPEMTAGKAQAVAGPEYKPYRPIEKIFLVEEIREEEYNGIKDFITIYGEGRVNINTCTEEVMEALDMGSSLIYRILVYRKGADEEIGTEDDGIFHGTEWIVSTLKSESSLSSMEEMQLNTLISKGLLGVRSDYFRINIDIHARGGKLIKNYNIVMGRKKKDSDVYVIKEWRER